MVKVQTFLVRAVLDDCGHDCSSIRWLIGLGVKPSQPFGWYVGPLDFFAIPEVGGADAGGREGIGQSLDCRPMCIVVALGILAVFLVDDQIIAVFFAVEGHSGCPLSNPWGIQ